MSVKLVAIAIIGLLLVASLLVLLIPTPTGPQGQGGAVKVAVIDSGIDATKVPSGAIVAQRSFILAQYGYAYSDTSTEDSHPGGVPHGSIVARTVLDVEANIALVNAKVISGEGAASTPAVIAAIMWAIEENCSVINLSLGSSPSWNDPLRDVVRYAMEHGVIVVSAAGNSGDGGLGTSSVTSPSVYGAAIAVGALAESGTPASYSSVGPTSERTMKPDLVAPGYAETSNAVVYGTSFASPRVAGAAAALIDYCTVNSIPWTPGLIKAVLMKTADKMSHPEYVVGAGRLNLDRAREFLQSLGPTTEIPLVTYVHPHSLPLQFERLFYGDNYSFNVQVINSRDAVYELSVDSPTPEVFGVPSAIEANQSTFFALNVSIPADINSTHLSATVYFTHGSDRTNLTLSLSIQEAVARVAFDISHTTWSIDTTYGQFRHFYMSLTGSEISVTEIRHGRKITAEYLSQFDAVVVLDPCVYVLEESDPYNPSSAWINFTDDEILAYEQYFEMGGGVFVATLSADYANLTAVNTFLEWSGFSLNDDVYPDRDSPTEITELYPHPMTAGVASFDYLGATINVSVNGTILATTPASRPVLGCLENNNTGRIVVTGTNFFLDNWGMNRKYEARDDAVLAIQIVMWLAHLL